MRIFTVAAALLLLLCSSAFGQMPAGPMPCANCQPMAGHGMEAMGSPMPFKMGPDLRRACHADLGALGIPEEARKALEAERLELQKLVIRNLSELKILGMELDQMLATRNFDPDAAGKTLSRIAETENTVRGAHLKFLRSLASKLDDKGWEALRGELAGATPCGMPTKETMMPCGYGYGNRRHCDNCPCGQMPCGQMQGSTMQSGGMMPQMQRQMHGGMMPCDMIQGGMKTETGAKQAEDFFKDK